MCKSAPMNRKKRVALCVAALLMAMTCLFVAVPAPSASAQTPVSGTFTLSSGTGNGTYDTVTGETVTGVANWMAYILAFLKEIAGRLFDLASGGFAWAETDGEWVLVHRELPEMTEIGKNLVGRLMIIFTYGGRS